PKCGCDDPTMIEPPPSLEDYSRASARQGLTGSFFCNTCSYDWPVAERSRRYGSLDELIARTGLRRDEVVTLADIGALDSFGYDRRSALWQAERAVRPAGELFTESVEEGAPGQAG